MLSEYLVTHNPAGWKPEIINENTVSPEMKSLDGNISNISFSTASVASFASDSTNELYLHLHLITHLYLKPTAQKLDLRGNSLNAVLCCFTPRDLIFVFLKIPIEDGCHDKRHRTQDNIEQHPVGSAVRSVFSPRLQSNWPSSGFVFCFLSFAQCNLKMDCMSTHCWGRHCEEATTAVGN